MDEFDQQLLSENPAWQQVLGMYARLADEPEHPRSEGESGPRFHPRIASLEEMPPEELAEIHGQLIALGWLRFQLEGRQAGLMYRISPEGREALAHLQETAQTERAA
jgi:hypothetical protein